MKIKKKKIKIVGMIIKVKVINIKVILHLKNLKYFIKTIYSDIFETMSIININYIKVIMLIF